MATWGDGNLFLKASRIEFEHSVLLLKWTWIPVNDEQVCFPVFDDEHRTERHASLMHSVIPVRSAPVEFRGHVH